MFYRLAYSMHSRWCSLGTHRSSLALPYEGERVANCSYYLLGLDLLWRYPHRPSLVALAPTLGVSSLTFMRRSLLHSLVHSSTCPDGLGSSFGLENLWCSPVPFHLSICSPSQTSFGPPIVTVARTRIDVDVFGFQGKPVTVGGPIYSSRAPIGEYIPPRHLLTIHY